MRIVEPVPTFRTAGDADQRDLVEVLHDVADEYDAGTCALSTFAHEVGAIMMAFDVVDDPAWLAALGEEWVKLRVLRAEQLQRRTLEPTEAQSAAGRAIADRLRHLITVWDDSSGSGQHA